MKGHKVLLLIAALFMSLFAVGGTLIVSASVEPSSTWTMESGIRLEGGWPSNPCVIKLPNGTYRMYYTDLIMEYYPLGSVIKSAVSADGLTWTREIGTRVGYGNGSETGHAGSPEVIVLPDGSYRMYYENTYYDAGIGDYRSQFLSAVSVDGFAWTKEPGIRVNYGGTYDSIRMYHIDIIVLSDGTYRMYYSGYDGTHYRILSAISTDGLIWTKEAGVRIDVGGVYDSMHVLSSVTVRIPDGRYIMFYCGHSELWAAQILSAVSADGLMWTKEDGIRIGRGSYALVAPSAIVRLSGNNYRMYIAADRYPVWTDRMRILSAIGGFPLSTFINPLSASICEGDSLTFTSTATGCTPPYSYQWYFNGNPVSGATSSSWTFTPTTGGICYVYLKVTDVVGNTTQSETATITVASVPVGGYSIPIEGHPLATHLTLCVTLTALFAIGFVVIRRKTKRNVK